VNHPAASPWKTVRRIALAACVVLSFCAYVTGWPLWSPWLLLAAVPALCCAAWIWTGRLRRYRLLFVIYGLAVLTGTYEAWQYRTIPVSVTEAIDLPPGAGEPDLFLDGDLPSVLFDLYPDRSEFLFVRGFQIKLCGEHQDSPRPYRVCDQFPSTDLATVREYFERALACGNKTDENLYYHYVEVLMRQAAPQDEIDAAAEQWRRLFPFSDRRDPRDVFASADGSAPAAATQTQTPGTP
jgi:hypothetical protein